MKKQNLQYFYPLLVVGSVYSSQAYALLQVSVDAQVPEVSYNASDTTGEKSIYGKARASSFQSGLGSAFVTGGASWPVCDPADPASCPGLTYVGDSEALAKGEINAELGRFRGITQALKTSPGIGGTYASVFLNLEDQVTYHPGQPVAFDVHIDLTREALSPYALNAGYGDKGISDYSISVCLTEGSAEACDYDPIAGFEYSNYGLSTKLKGTDAVFTPLEDLDDPFNYHWDVTNAVPFDTPLDMYIRASLKTFCFDDHCASELNFSNTAYIGIQGNYESSNGYLFPYTVPTAVPLPMTWVLFLSGLGVVRFIPKRER